MNGNILKLKKEASERKSSVMDDGTNKFITSPNDSMRNEEAQHPDYSFGDL